MAIVVPFPDDATYDYVRIEGPRIEIGMDLLACWAVRGELTHAFPPVGEEQFWLYFMITVNPDGTLSSGIALFPETPESYPNEWWARFAIWKREPKLGDGETLTAADGSKWIYPAGEDGRVVCYDPGSTYARGARRFRGELTTDVRDLWICDDAEWDWLPITDGSDIDVGDTITFLMANHATVDQIDVVETDTSRGLSFVDTDDGVELGWWVGEVFGVPAVGFLNDWSWFRRLPKPAADTTFAAPDGSRWIYVDGAYYCWGVGRAYPTGAMLRRGEIDGGLI